MYTLNKNSIAPSRISNVGKWGRKSLPDGIETALLLQHTRAQRPGRERRTDEKAHEDKVVDDPLEIISKRHRLAYTKFSAEVFAQC